MRHQTRAKNDLDLSPPFHHFITTPSTSLSHTSLSLSPQHSFSSPSSLLFSSPSSSFPSTNQNHSLDNTHSLDTLAVIQSSPLSFRSTSHSFEVLSALQTFDHSDTHSFQLLLSDCSVVELRFPTFLNRLLLSFLNNTLSSTGSSPASPPSSSQSSNKTSQRKHSSKCVLSS